MKLAHLIAAAAITAAGITALPGCQTEMAAVPGNATLVASGTGTTTYTAADSGTVYIYDKTWNKLVYSGDVRAGQTIKVDTANSKILVDDAPRAEQVSVGGGSEFQFYLRPGTVNTTTVERRTVIERDVHQ